MAINILDPKVYNRISAGEVVEKPASIVKEVVENSIDAGADVIRIEITGGGIKSIVVSDNGSGILKEDLKKAFIPHATSKIKDVEDLNKILTLGFRGEALASIASVCHVTLSSRTLDAETGYTISVDGGDFSEIKEIARNKGTTIEISDLFYNTPARAKFLRREKQEEGEITHIVQKFMLAHPEISFLYIVDGKQVYNTLGSDLPEIIYTIYGKEIYDNLIKIDHTEGDMTLRGFVVSPKVSKPNRTYQTLFVNSRYVENYMISSAVSGVYQPFLMKGKFPIYVLNLIVPEDSVDVNVHPSKREVKFETPNKIFGFVIRAIEKAVAGADHIATLDDYQEDFVAPKTEFNHIEISKLEPLSQTEGSSFRKSLDNPEYIGKPVEVSKVDVSEISSIVLDKEEIKKTSNFFFDQSEEKYTFDDHLNSKTPEKLFKESLKDQIKVKGVIFSTYIAVEFEDDLYLVDQHAAHERQLYDKLVSRVEKSEVVKQSLLMPFETKLNNKETEILNSSLGLLNDLGFEVCQKDDKLIISAIPLVLDGINLQDFVQDVLSDQEVFNKKSSEIIKDRLAQNACKHAIKAGDNLPLEDLADLIEKMKKGLLLCPHGRPVMVKITKKDLEKLFKRIV